MNGFLAALDNNATPPVNPFSLSGNVVWPSPFLVQTYTPAETIAQTRLFGDCPTRLIRFVKAIQLLLLVEDSVLSSSIALADPTITYENQLQGQAAGVDPSYLNAVSDALGQMPNLDPSILPDDLLQVWKNALCNADKLATFVVYFGRKNAVSA